MLDIICGYIIFSGQSVVTYFTKYLIKKELPFDNSLVGPQGLEPAYQGTQAGPRPLSDIYLERRG